MTIRQHGGIFGRNPTFNELTTDSNVSIGTDEKLTPNGNKSLLLSGTTGSEVIVKRDDTGVTDGDFIGGFAFLNVDGSNSPPHYFGFKGVALNAFGSNEIEVHADFHTYNTGGTPTAKFTSTGLAFANGKGIDFSATSGTGTSELFDDYEEGTWTPVVTSSSGTLTTVTVTWAKYTKVGNKVFVSARFALTDAGTGSGSLQIDGLPYTVASTGSGNSPVQGRDVSSATLLHGQFGGNLARIGSVQTYSNGNPIVAGNTYVISGTYFA